MSNAEFKTLLDRYLNDSLSVEELQELLSHLRQHENTEALQQAIQQALQDNQFKALADKSRSDIIFQKLMQEASAPKRKMFVWLPWLAAAAVMAGVFFAAYYLFIKDDPPNTVAVAEQKQPAKDVAPGGNKAFLQLSDGSIITLDDSATGMLAQQGNTKVIKLNNGRLQYNCLAQNGTVMYNTITTPRGGQYHIILPDGSKVWLNAASSLKFPTAFAGKERSVQLTGEAYFEIAHEKNMPFQVQVNDMKVEVLGTHFNVMSYENEKTINTTLLQGSVKIGTAIGSRQSAVLSPGQQAVFTADSRLTIHDNADIESAIAWKNGLFQFNSADIQTIMRQIERWYDVEVLYKGPIPEGHYSGIVPRDNNLLKVLRILEESDLKFAIEGKKLYLL